MGSSKNQNNLKKPRISNKTLDKKADSNLVSILKQSFNQLEIENKELHRYNRELQNRLNVGINLYKELKEGDEYLQNKIDDAAILYTKLKQRNEFLENELKEHQDTMNQMGKEAWKLKELVDKLREAIEEPVELDDK